MIEAKVIAHSRYQDELGYTGRDIVTLSLKYPRFIHSEFMTHRVFSRNAASSRAIPVSKMIEQVNQQPEMPIYWGSNIPGMQAGEELTGMELDKAKYLWVKASSNAVEIAREMADLGLHKQVVNRILEPFQTMNTIVTSTEWSNFFDLRISPLAQPEIRELAVKMKEAIDASTAKILTGEEFHLPYVSDEDISRLGIDNVSNFHLCMVSAARCARVSYLNHDGSNPGFMKDLTLAIKLKEARHASPFEHVARFVKTTDSYDSTKNFKDWVQFRHILNL